MNPNQNKTVNLFDGLLKIAGALIIISVLMLQFQWIYGLKDLSSFGKMFVPMAEETALLFIISGYILAINYKVHQNKILLVLNKYLILFIGFVSIITIIDIIANYAWGGSDFIGPKGVIRGGFQTGKMSFLTSICFILICLSFYAIYLKKERHSFLFSFPVLLICFIINVGYSDGVPFLYESKYIPMSWPTSVVFIFISLCLSIASGPQSIPLCYFVGNSTRSLLMRNIFLPIFSAILITIFLNTFNINQHSLSNTLISSAIDLLIIFFIGIFISRVSKRIGDEIDKHKLEKKIAIEKLLEISQAVEQSPISIIITDKNGLVIYANPKFEEISGYSLDEVKGKNPNILKSGYTSNKEYELLWDSIKSGHKWQGEFHNRNKSGELYWEYATISAIKNENGEIINFLALKEDIDDRKKIEEKLRNISWKQNHEIRAPLTTILGIISAMKYKISIEEKLLFLNKLEEASQKLDIALKATIVEAQFQSKFSPK